jgi:hypothetical protein
MSIKQTHTQDTAPKESIVPVRSSKKPSSSHRLSHKHLEGLQGIRSLRKDTMLSCRYELKYRIRETTARAMAQYIQSYISPDSYARNSRDYQYVISSLYFDSDELHLCKETLLNKTNRFKLRVRCYDDNPQSPCFFEIKRRLNSVIRKDRARLPKDVFTKIIRDYYIPDHLYKQDKETLYQFQFYLRVLQARPVVLVRYMRQAFEGDTSNRIRITFDRALSFKTVEYPLISTNGTGWQNVPMDFVILEIKFTDRYPLWLNDLVKIFDLKQAAMSKYVSSIKQSCAMGFCGPRCQIGI